MASKLKFEEAGREKLLTVFPMVNWQFAEDDMCPFDAFSLENGKTILVEIKTRDFPSFQYEDAYLEVDKVFRLNQVKLTENTQIIAVYHFSNNVNRYVEFEQIKSKRRRWCNAVDERYNSG
ncbi:hypothetical protein [Sphingobacterium daejeonense]|uniref:hypothetical protein n=1 Tax=Sphingobacterium daejeonense TaxID=371142 RepID=UPI0010C44DD7|nr:hypothetical protein [Sphingobacterium daejeonense]VTP97655.1 Uncharacterised protein [Sphingobacterium daejeonense]